jgi:4-hydroxybenzoate polyprenyltransferase
LKIDSSARKVESLVLIAAYDPGSMVQFRQILNVCTDWLLFTSGFAGCCAVGLCLATERLLLQRVPPLFTFLHALVFGGVVTVYNLHYVIKRSAPELSDRYAWSVRHQFTHISLIVAGALLCAFSLFHLPWHILVACVVLGLLSFAYSLPILPFVPRKRLKDFGWIKIMVLTGVWTIVTSILPMLYWNRDLAAYPFEILLRFVFMFTLCVAFDIRDMQTDLEAGIDTLPNLIGVANSYRLMNLALGLFVALSIVQYLRYPSPVRLGGAVLAAVVARLAIEYARRHPTDKVYLAYVDGTMLFYAIMVLLPY